MSCKERDGNKWFITSCFHKVTLEWKTNTISQYLNKCYTHSAICTVSNHVEVQDLEDSRLPGSMKTCVSLSHESVETICEA